MTLLTLVSGWFGLKAADSTFDSASLRIENHYEEADEYDEGDDPEEAAEPPVDEEEYAPDSCFRVSRLIAASYEEEIAHQREAEQLLLDGEPLVPEE